MISWFAKAATQNLTLTLNRSVAELVILCKVWTWAAALMSDATVHVLVERTAAPRP